MWFVSWMLATEAIVDEYWIYCANLILLHLKKFYGFFVESLKMINFQNTSFLHNI